MKSSHRTPATPRPAPRVPLPSLRPPPAVWRDGWAWLALAPLVALVAHSLGAPLGEPVAEDFDFLHRALLEGNHTLLDGGGSLAFWRPLSHQVYYQLVGPLILAHPWLVAGLHVGLLGLATLLLYRALRCNWPGPAAAMAAAFPPLAESTRMIISWPTQSVDVGLYLFSALAVHEAARRRLGTMLAAVLGALLCKEVAVVTALLVPWLPGGERRGLKERARWAVATGLVVAAWGVAYLLIRRHAGLALPHHLESDAEVLATPVTTRLGWALGNSVRAVFSLARTPGAWDGWIGATAAVVVVAGLGLAVADGRSRARLRPKAGWAAWGLVWFALASGTLVAIFPFWAPSRSMYGSIGLGVALAGLLSAAGPALLAALMAVKLLAFALSPGAPRVVAGLPQESGAFTDFGKIARLQLLMRETRGILQHRFPQLPHGAMIGQNNMPIAAQYAFGGSKALQVWYRDTTLRWVRSDEFNRRPDLDLRTVVQYQERAGEELALVEPEAVRRVLEAYTLISRGEFARALREVGRADSIQSDRSARVFIGGVAGLRALILGYLGNAAESEREALRGLSLAPRNPESRLVLAAAWADRGEYARAEAMLEALLVDTPDHPSAAHMLEVIRERRARAAAPGAR